MNFRIWAAGLLLVAIAGGAAFAATPEAATGNQIRRMGLEARLDVYFKQEHGSLME